MSTYEHVVVKGIPVPDHGSPGLRKEFTDWATPKPETSIQVSLFIRALQKFYDRSYTETLSYFQIAAIHGYPGNLPWDKSSPPNHARGDRLLYCNHNLLTFPTWHRPYMVLFEQTIYLYMGDVIDQLKFPSEDEKQAWIHEASQWRLPYWDWALPANGGQLPALFWPPNVQIRSPTGPPDTVPNPLYRYQLFVDGKEKKMGDLDPPYKVNDVPQQGGPTLPWSQCSGTSRWGIKSLNPDDWSDGVNNYAGVPEAINNPEWYSYDPNKPNLGPPVADLVNRLLSYVTSWKNFASTQLNPVEKDRTLEQYLSLEYIHNNLHGFIGGDDLVDGIGHMQNVPSAAFDPVFYMHHCNIDRLLAIWQVLNPDAWFDDQKSSQEVQDDLTPFHQSQELYYKSDDVRDWTNFGYDYEVLVRRPDESDADRIARVKRWVAETYPSTGRLLSQDKSGVYGAQDVKNGLYEDYVINVTYDRYALNGASYRIYFFLGAPDHEIGTPSTRKTSLLKHPKLVGSVYNFGSPAGSGELPHCANCRAQHDDGILSKAQVPITIPLYQLAANKKVKDFNSMSEAEVTTFLKKELSWVAASGDGKIISWDRLPKTKIFVIKGEAKHHSDPSKLSSYRGYKEMSRVTEGKGAGAERPDY